MPNPSPLRWNETSDYGKATMVNRSLSDLGTAFGVSLHLGDDVLEKALKHKHGAADYVAKRITRKLAAAGLPSDTFWLGVDVSKSGRLHVHGGIAISDNADVLLYRRALLEAGGTWNASNRQRQLDIRPQHAPDGWADYALRFATRRHQEPVTDGRMIFMPNRLRRLARETYTAARKKSVVTYPVQDVAA